METHWALYIEMYMALNIGLYMALSLSLEGSVPQSAVPQKLLTVAHFLSHGLV
jgi:hypothetical protein